MAISISIKPCHHGRGVFTNELINSGDTILEFSGEIINFEQTLAKGSESMNALQIDKNLYLDIQPPGVLVNHSCEPNSGLVGLKLIAIRNIDVNEEIFYDYSTVMSENYDTMKCNCGCVSCRTIIRDFDYLPQHKKNQYLSLGIVPQFITDTIFA